MCDIYSRIINKDTSRFHGTTKALQLTHCKQHVSTFIPLKAAFPLPRERALEVCQQGDSGNGQYYGIHAGTSST